MTKIERIDAEILKARERMAEIQARIRTLEGEKTAEENAMIVQMVRKQRMTFAELERFLNKHGNTLTNPTKTPPVIPGAVKKESEGNPNESKN